MKKLAVFARMLILGVIATQFNAQAQCDNATMKGTYVMSASGTLGGSRLPLLQKSHMTDTGMESHSKR